MENNARIVSIFGGRFPGEKAAAIFEDKNAESFAGEGIETIVLAPRRLGRLKLEKRAYRVAYLPTLDFTTTPILGSVAGYVHTVCFSLSVFVWLFVNGRASDRILSNEMLPLIAASLLHKHTLYELHDYADRSRSLYAVLFRRVRHILATNEWKRGMLAKEFQVPPEKIFVERNAVDAEMFGGISKADARSRLDLPQGASIVVYTGHLYEWKGADVLARGSKLIPETRVVFVGGTVADVSRFKASWGSESNIQIVGQVAYEQIPLWQAAADVLVLPNSAKEDISVHYTSPMKLFEYMASGRPIVASDLPSIREVLPETVGYYAVPDDPESFANAIKKALSDDGTTERAQEAREIALDHTWEKRAKRILALI